MTLFLRVADRKTAGKGRRNMGDQFLDLLKKVTVFMLAGQIIVHFLPSGGYEKYVKMMISIMVLSQIALPVLSLGKFDAAGAYASAMEKYEQEIERIGKQVEESDLQGRDYQEEALDMTARQKLEPCLAEYGLSLLAVSVPEDAKLRLEIAEGNSGAKTKKIDKKAVAPMREGEGTNAEGSGRPSEEQRQIKTAFAGALGMEMENLEVIWNG